MSFNIYPSAEDFNGPGDYPFSIVNFTDESGSGYVPYDTGDTENGGILTLHEDGSMTLQLAHPEATPNLHLVSIHTGGTIYADQRINLTATFRNEGTKTYTEGLYIVAIPEGTDESGIDYSDYLQGSNGVTAPIYGKSTMEVPAFSWGLDAGRYTIHFCRETTQEDGSLAYLPVPEDAPQMLEVKPIPDHPVLLMDEYPLDVWNDEYKQEAAVWFGATVYLRALSQSYEGRLELWALKDGVDPSEEVLVFAYAQDNLSIGNSSTVYIYGFYGDTDAFFDMEEGTYTAYLKYEVNGEMQRIEGDYNQDKFRVVRSDKPQLYLTAPVVVNNGEPVPMGSTVTVEMQVSSRVAFNGRVEVYSSTSNEAALYSSSQSVSLEAGEMKTLAQVADMAFIGKSLSPNIGGQTPIDCAALGVPMIYGPYMTNFRRVCETLERENAAIKVPDAPAAIAELTRLAQSPELRDTLAQAAKKWHQSNIGAADRTYDAIVKIISAK